MTTKLIKDFGTIIRVHLQPSKGESFGQLTNQKKKFTIMAKDNFELFDDRVLVKPNAAEEKTAGGIIIPDTAKEKPQKGKVIAVGKGKYADQTGNLIPLQIKAGDTVLYGKYGGTEITIEGEDYLIMRASDILMKVS
jgi:chaperonin GroES